MVAVAYERWWSFTRATIQKALTGKILVFCHWSLKGGCRLREVVAHKGSTSCKQTELLYSRIVTFLTITEQFPFKITVNAVRRKDIVLSQQYDCTPKLFLRDVKKLEQDLKPREC